MSSMTYQERLKVKAGCTVEGVLLAPAKQDEPSRLNLELASKLQQEGITALHLLSFQTFTGVGAISKADYWQRIRFLELKLFRYGIRVASLRINVYDPNLDESANDQVKREIHELFRLPQNFLTVVYDHPCYSKAYMCAANSMTTLYDKEPEFPLVDTYVRVPEFP